MKAVLMTMLKTLPVPLLVELFLDMAEEFAKRSDNTVDDKLVQILRAAFQGVPPKP